MIQKKITSKDNEKIKFLKKLSQKKYREQEGKFVVENFITIYDALISGYDFESFFVTEEFLEKNSDKIEEVFNKTKTKEYYLIDEKINKHFSQLDNSSGVCAVYSKKESKLNFDKPVIYLNSIKDPGNLGTILRSALAFDIESIVVDEHCVDIYNAKTISAAKDAIFKVNIVFDRELNVLQKIKKEMKIYSTSLGGDSGLDVLKKEDVFCVILGDETHGVDQKIIELSDGLIKIDIGDKIESLNVAVAAGIVFYEINR